MKLEHILPTLHGLTFSLILNCMYLLRECSAYYAVMQSEGLGFSC